MKEFKGFTKGINIGGWFSQCEYGYEHFENFIDENDIKKIVSWELDHIRLPIDYNAIENEDGTPDEKGLAILDDAVKMITDNGLNVILDLHKTAGFFFGDIGLNSLFDNEQLQKRFISLWISIAKRYVSYGDKVAFELLNEIVEDNSLRWNKLLKETIIEIRKIAPYTKIIIGGIQWNSPHTLNLLEKPYDENVVFTFHFYEPFLFTHQLASWIEQMPKDKDMKYPGTIEDYRKRSSEINCFGSGLYNDGITEIGADFIESIVLNAINVANEHNVALYCGEYGVIDQANPEDTLQWFKDINSVFVKYGISRAVWTFKQKDFGINDEHYSGVIQDLIKYL